MSAPRPPARCDAPGCDLLAPYGYRAPGGTRGWFCRDHRDLGEVMIKPPVPRHAAVPAAKPAPKPKQGDLI